MSIIQLKQVLLLRRPLYFPTAVCCWYTVIFLIASLGRFLLDYDFSFPERVFFALTYPGVMLTAFVALALGGILHSEPLVKLGFTACDYCIDAPKGILAGFLTLFSITLFVFSFNLVWAGAVRLAGRLLTHRDNTPAPPGPDHQGTSS